MGSLKVGQSDEADAKENQTASVPSEAGRTRFDRRWLENVSRCEASDPQKGAMIDCLSFKTLHSIIRAIETKQIKLLKRQIISY